MNNHRRRLNATMRNANADWYRLQAKADEDVAVIDLFDEIGMWGTTAADFVKELRDIEAGEIQLHINSPGGDVYDGIAIMNALKAHEARVVVTVEGIAASAASFIAMAGDEVVMASHAEMMIHDAWGICIGNAEDMHDLATRLDRASDNIAAVYQERAGGTVAQWREAMRAESWYSDEEAVAAGLADRVLKSKKADSAKNRFDLSLFNYAGRADAPPPVAKTEPDPATAPPAADAVTERLSSSASVRTLADLLEAETAAV